MSRIKCQSSSPAPRPRGGIGENKLAPSAIRSPRRSTDSPPSLSTLQVLDPDPIQREELCQSATTSSPTLLFPLRYCHHLSKSTEALISCLCRDSWSKRSHINFGPAFHHASPLVTRGESHDIFRDLHNFGLAKPLFSDGTMPQLWPQSDQAREPNSVESKQSVLQVSKKKNNVES